MEIDSCTGPYLRSKSVQVSKKASVYAAFHCCRGVQVCPVLVRFPLFLYTCTTMKTPVFMRVCAIVVHFLIPGPGATAFVLSQEGDIRPPFFGSRGRQGLRSRTPLRAVELCSTPRKPFEKGLSENFTCLHLTWARAACSPPAASSGAVKRRARIECPGTGRGLSS